MKTILSIIPYSLTAHDFFLMRDPIKDKPNRHFFNSIPEWCVRDDGSIAYAADYHQFSGLIDSEDKNPNYLFDITPVDEILREEINNVGVEYLFDEYDFRPLFEKIKLNEVPYKSLKIPHNIHIVIELNYIGNGEDFDMFVEVLGFLNDKMELHKV